MVDSAVAELSEERPCQGSRGKVKTLKNETVHVASSSRLKGYLPNIPSEHLGEESGGLSQAC